MNIDSNTPVDTDDLDLFSEEFFGTAKPVEEPTEEKGGEQEDTPAPSEEKQEPETEKDSEAEDEDDTEVESEEESKFRVKKKLTARERVEQINAKYREEERLRVEAETRLRELELRLQSKEEEVPKQDTVRKGPSPDDKLEDGEEKYPLGEYDPDYIRDLHKFAAEEAKKEALQEFQKQQEEAQRVAAMQEITEEWNGKVTASLERLPDLQEKALELEQNLAGSDPAVVESLAVTIMSLENGPDVLYYLSQNVNEAKTIARGGPQALIALGKLDAMMKPSKPAEPVKITEAKEPPPSRTRGVSGRFSVSADTDNLDDFEKLYFQK